MKNESKHYKPKRIIDGYITKKQLHGGFKIIEISHISNENFLRKRVLHKGLTLSDAEDIVYRLESRLK